MPPPGGMHWSTKTGHNRGELGTRIKLIRPREKFPNEDSRSVKAPSKTRIKAETRVTLMELDLNNRISFLNNIKNPHRA